MKQERREQARAIWRDPVWSKVISTVILAAGGAALALIFATTRGCAPRDRVGRALAVQPAEPERAVEQNSPKVTEPPAKPLPPSATRRAPSPAVPPSPSAVVFSEAPPAGDCQPYTPARAPNVSLHAGDLIVAGGGGVYRLDRDMKETRLTNGEHVIDARGVAVAPDGQIYLSTMACRKGAIVRVDPKTGTQTPLFFGFGTPMGIYTDGETLLVGDEHPRGGGPWGELWRINLKDRTRAAIHTFTRDAVATSIARNPRTGAIYFAVRRAIFELDAASGGLRPADDLDGLMNVHAMTISPQGEMYIGEYDASKIMHMQLGQPEAQDTYAGYPTLWNLAAAFDGRSLFAAAGSGSSARVYRVPLDSGETAAEVWAARSDGFAVFVTVVGQ